MEMHGVRCHRKWFWFPGNVVAQPCVQTGCKYVRMYGTNQNKKLPFRIRRTLHSIITEGTLEPCHLHLVLSTCLIALVVVAVNITKSRNIIIVAHVDNTK